MYSPPVDGVAVLVQSCFDRVGEAVSRVEDYPPMMLCHGPFEPLIIYTLNLFGAIYNIL